MTKNMKDVLASAFTLLIAKGIVTQEEMDIGKKKGYDYLCEMLDEKGREHMES